jgi:hypothetical protein
MLHYHLAECDVLTVVVCQCLRSWSRLFDRQGVGMKRRSSFSRLVQSIAYYKWKGELSHQRLDHSRHCGGDHYENEVEELK